MYEITGGFALTPRGILKNASIAVDGDRIADIGKTADMRRRHKFSKSLGSKDMLICPGFIDAHLHSSQIATRGFTMGSSLLAWLKKYIWKWEGRMTRQQAYSCASLAYLELIRSGVTSFVDYTSVRHTGEAFRAASEMGLRATIGKTLMDRNSPPALIEETDKALSDTERLIRKYHGSEKGRLRYSITPRFGITCTDALLTACRDLSGKYGVLLTTHASESPGEIFADRKNYGKSAIRHFHGLGLLGKRTLLVHCVHLDRQESAIIARTGTSVAHCPGSNIMLASGIADIPRMLAMKIPVALGSDMAAYYNMSMFEQMRLACLIQKIKTGKPDALSHEAAFQMATSGGARAIGLGHETGMLTIGKKADIVLLDARSPELTPLNDIRSQIVYGAVNSSVDSVICDGKILMEGKTVAVADEQKIIERARDSLGFS